MVLKCGGCDSIKQRLLLETTPTSPVSASTDVFRTVSTAIEGWRDGLAGLGGQRQRQRETHNHLSVTPVPREAEDI